MDSCLLTIVTVVYNSKEKLEKTIKSVKSKKFEGAEFIVVDGGSTDGSIGVVRKYDEVVDQFVSEPDKGIYDAMNKGISMSTGRYLHFLNAGDTFAESLILSETLKVIAEEEVDLAKFQYLKSNNVFTEKINYPFLLRYSPNHQSIIYDRKHFKDHVFDDDLRYASDYGHLLKIFPSLKIKYFQFPLIVFDEEYSASNRALISIIWKERAQCVLRADGINMFFRIFAFALSMSMHHIRRFLY